MGFIHFAQHPHVNIVNPNIVQGQGLVYTAKKLLA